MVAGVAALSAAALAAMSLTAPPPASGQEPDEQEFGLWELEDEIEFEPREPVPGRRLYFEELRVIGDRAHVTLRAATDLEIRVRAFGGLRGRELRFWSAAALDERGTITYSLPLVGDEPSLTLSWEDGIGQGRCGHDKEGTDSPSAAVGGWGALRSGGHGAGLDARSR